MAGEVTVDAAHRITELREIDLDALLGRAEDVGELLDYTAAQQHELLGWLWTAITDVAASRKRSRMRESRLRRSADRLQRQAGQAAAAGRAEYARQAMAWRSTILRHVAELTAEQAALRVSEERLSDTVRRLQANIEASRVHREMISREYTAPQAATGQGQLLGGLSAEPRLGGSAVLRNQIQAQLDLISRRTALETAIAQIKGRRHG